MNIFFIFKWVHPIRRNSYTIIKRNIKTLNQKEIDVILCNVYKSFLDFIEYCDKITEKMSEHFLLVKLKTV